MLDKVNESSTAVFTERCILAGWFLGAIGFGVHLTLFTWCFHLLYLKQKKPADWLKLLYICVLFALGNIGHGTPMKSAEVVYIDGRNYPGGPNAIYLWDSSSSLMISFESAYIISIWLQDGLLLYRFWVFYGGITSIILLVELNHPGINAWSNISINLGIPTWSLSIVLNVILTSLIAGRLVYMRRRLRRLLGNKGSDYLSITAMLVESAALVTLDWLWFIIPYALNSPVQHLALPLLGQMQSIAPLLVILRVLQGRAWSKKTMSNLNSTVRSGIQFHRPSLHTIGSGSGEYCSAPDIIVLETTRDTNTKDICLIKRSDTKSDIIPVADRV